MMDECWRGKISDQRRCVVLQDAEKAISMFNGTELDERVITVKVTLLVCIFCNPVRNAMI